MQAQEIWHESVQLYPASPPVQPLVQPFYKCWTPNLSWGSSLSRQPHSPLNTHLPSQINLCAFVRLVLRFSFTKAKNPHWP